MIKSVTTYSSRPWGNKVKKRFKVTLIDLQGIDHTEIIGVFKIDTTEGGTTQANTLLASKKQAEVEQYKDSIREGINPFLRPSLWNTRVELLVPILTDALSLPATDSIVYNGLPYVALVTDAELMALFGKTQAWVDSLRLKASDLLSGKSTFDAYIPPLGVA